MLYNTDISLWVNCTLPLSLIDGHVVSKGEGTLARFRDNEHAKEVLTEAGYTEGENNTFTK